MPPEPSDSTAALPGPAQELSGRARIVFWLVTAAFTGAVIMGLELVAFRLYAPYLGYSIYVWGTMISVVMVALSLGYALGGWLADRSQSDLPLYAVVLGSALYQLVIVFVVRSLLISVSQSGEFLGTVLATLVIFMPPMAGLAITSPFVIRLIARTGHVGVTAGRVYALSTVGSIAGIFATTFFLVPRFGTQVTLQVLCVLSAVIGILGLARRRRSVLVAGLLFSVLLFKPGPRLPSYELWRAESAYNMVRVIRYRGYIWLALNQAEYSHSTRKEGSFWSGSYQDDFAIGPLLVPAHRLLVLGMGAGGTIRVTRRVAPDIQVDAVEIDPMVVEAARRFFGLHPEAPWLSVHVADARPWLARDEAQYDLVHVDLYHGGPYVPFYLVTEEFFRLVRDRMSDEGLLMMNVYDRGKDRQILFSTGATLERVFPFVAVLSRQDQNHIVLAFQRLRSLEDIRRRLAEAREDNRVGEVAARAAAALQELVPPAGSRVFTDDHAPIEEMTRRMLSQPESRASP
jgi:spermidine synthase